VNCALLGHDAASIANSISTFRDNLSVLYSRDKNSLPLKTGAIDFPEISVTICHCSLLYRPEERWVIPDRKCLQISHLFQ